MALWLDAAAQDARLHYVGFELYPMDKAQMLRALARLIDERTAQREPRAADHAVTRERLSELRRSLVRSSHEERLRMRGIRKGRADLLPVGAVVLETVAEVLDLPGYRICDWGLREGVLLDGLLPD